jgi:GNAT superfamily N-acetyltransferase
MYGICTGKEKTLEGSNKMQLITNQWKKQQSQSNLSSVTVRPIQFDDVGLIDAMHRRLSPESLYFRYLQQRQPTLDEIATLYRFDPVNRAGFVATVQQPGETVVGVAHYVREAYTQQPTAEPGILVEDRFQGQGVGRRLWQQLHDHARANQISRLRVFFEPSNQRMLRLLQGSGFAYQANSYGGLSEYLVSLGEQPANPSLTSASPLRIGRLPLETQLARRLVLYPGERYHVPASYRLLRVVAELAYLTQAGQDHILSSGQELHLERSTDVALLSAANGEQVIVELFDSQN